jgi:TIR domain
MPYICPTCDQVHKELLHYCYWCGTDLFKTDTFPDKAVLTTRLESGESIVYGIKSDNPTIGKASYNEIVIPDWTVAEIPLGIRSDNGVFTVFPNGAITEVNGEQIPDKYILKDEDKISIGKTTLTFRKKPARLRVFLCHSSGDKKAVRKLYRGLLRSGFLAWLDEEDLLPGQDWDQEIRKVVRASHVILICLSRASVNKAGYVQKEIKFALDIAEEQPDGMIFLIPVRLEECEVPERFKKWHWVDLFEERGFDRLTESLLVRSRSLR